jgi:hypothetical protein
MEKEVHKLLNYGLRIVFRKLQIIYLKYLINIILVIIM